MVNFIFVWDLEIIDKMEKEKLSYKDEVKRAMNYLGSHKRVIFLGQGVKYRHGVIYETLEDVADEQKIEMPIMEDSQLGISIGLSMIGYIPVTIYPRFDFLLCATNQLVNHLDKLSQISKGKYNPFVIIRTAIGSKSPIDGGLQHTSDYTNAFRLLLKNIKVVTLDKKEEIFDEYKKALYTNNSTLFIEYIDMYNKEEK